MGLLKVLLQHQIKTETGELKRSCVYDPSYNLLKFQIHPQFSKACLTVLPVLLLLAFLVLIVVLHLLIHG